MLFNDKNKETCQPTKETKIKKMNKVFISENQQIISNINELAMFKKL